METGCQKVKVVDNEDEDEALQVPTGLDNCWIVDIVVSYLIMARLPSLSLLSTVGNVWTLATELWSWARLQTQKLAYILLALIAISLCTSNVV